MQMWFALAQSGLNPRNFGRLQNAASEFTNKTNLEAQESLHNATRLFLTFWNAVKDRSQEPELHVAENGRLQAIWSHQNGWFLVMEFGCNDIVFWAIYQDDDMVEGQQSSASIAELARNLQALPSKPLNWRC